MGYRFKGNSLVTLTEHWNGTQWKIVSSANPGTTSNQLSAIARIPGTRQFWSVGAYSNDNGTTSQTLIESWNGTSWTVVTSPNPGTYNTLVGVTAIAANNVWAVGSYNTPTTSTQTLIEHWNGTSWSVVSSPNVASNGALVAIKAISANNIWAVGSYQGLTQQNLIEHWNGTQWKIVTSPNTGASDQLEALTSIPGTKQLWAVGQFYNSNNISQTLVEQWNGTTWGIVSSPNPGTQFDDLRAITAISSTDIWAVGEYANSSGDVSQTLTEQWNGASWNVVPSPNGSAAGNFLDAATTIPNSSDVWAVGAYDTPTTTNLSLTEFYC